VGWFNAGTAERSIKKGEFGGCSRVNAPTIAEEWKTNGLFGVECSPW
jgi:hypothetical protein